MQNSLRWVSPLIVLLAVAGHADKSSADEMRPFASAALTSEEDLQTVSVTLDFAKIMTLDQPARTIVIGNPGIVDGTVADGRTLVLTGKVAGTTNIVVIGEGGQNVSRFLVHVVANRQLTTVYIGDEMKTFSCAGLCKPVISVGDEGKNVTHFDRAVEQTKARGEFASGRPTQ